MISVHVVLNAPLPAFTIVRAQVYVHTQVEVNHIPLTGFEIGVPVPKSKLVTLNHDCVENVPVAK
jgi:hypothetical protein